MDSIIAILAASDPAASLGEAGDVYIVVVLLLALVVLPAVLICFLVIPSVAPGWWGKVFRKSRGIAASRTSGLALRVSAATAEPGQELEVEVELAPKRDFHIRRAVVQLVRVEVYVKETKQRHHSSYYMSQVEEIAVEHVIFEEQAAHKRRNVEAAVKLTVPQDVLPTIQAPLVNRIKPGIFWRVKAEFDVPGKVDLVAEKDILVRKPPRTDILPSRPTFAESDNKTCSLTLSLESADICSQGSLAGVFQVKMLKDIDISGAAVELSSYARFGEAGSSIDIDKSVVAQATRLLAGRTYEWPFNLNIGPVTAPTLHTDKSMIGYYVRGKLDRKMRVDPSVSQDINVHI